MYPDPAHDDQPKPIAAKQNPETLMRRQQNRRLRIPSHINNVKEQKTKPADRHQIPAGTVPSRTSRRKLPKPVSFVNRFS
jgi:hypothetical protein